MTEWATAPGEPTQSPAQSLTIRGLREEPQRGANGAWAEVLFCLNEACGWREWTVEDLCADVHRLAQEGHRPSEIAARLGISERTVFRRLRTVPRGQLAAP